MIKPVSDCCQADIKINDGQSVTRYYICTKCDKPCDQLDEGKHPAMTPTPDELKESK